MQRPIKHAKADRERLIKHAKADREKLIKIDHAVAETCNRSDPSTPCVIPGG